MIKTTLKDFLGFIIKPDDRQIDLTVKSKLYVVLILFGLIGILSIVIIDPLLTLVSEMVPMSYNQYAYLTWQTSILLYVILVPLAEELFFRYFLRYNGLKTTFITQKKWTKIFPGLVYVSVICFGLVHLWNYSNRTTLFYLLSPLIILSQLAGGFILSYLRVRFNFLWGVLFHAMWNLTIFIIPYVSYSSTDAYSEKALNYTVTIEQELFFDEEKQRMKIDSVGDKIIFINAEHYSVQHILDTLYRKGRYVAEDELINLNFKSKDGVTKDAFIKILQKELEIQ
ncbi:CPBP family intramembrane glutamic endopeptidase [Flavobacterium sp.]|uniref:CPBP family intramembrane glutamic endopeptidase n=1 Tax=Flavobacterium sp. TaxID=239 RepID=UPI002B4B48D7|nr:CPBP family intramembrane glutamic endopeptidase [Flavobacterium sp.]HLF51032.1 CPBP family intramembrane glutamic endopeptidase [Flavobacterium sp.]